MDPVSKWLNGAFLVIGSLLGMATSWYLYRLTMRYVEESAAGGPGDLELGDEEDGVEGAGTGLLDEVDEMLDGDGQEGGAAAARKGEPRASQDGWGDFADDDDAEEGSAGRSERRDSTAWGLELDEDEVERGEAPQGRLRLD